MNTIYVKERFGEDRAMGDEVLKGLGMMSGEPSISVNPEYISVLIDEESRKIAEEMWEEYFGHIPTKDEI